MGVKHYFEVYIAMKYGVHSALLFQNLWFWIKKNQDNGQNFFDGYYWTYNSKKAFAELFPYMSERQIDYALKKLIDAGLVLTGNYNKVPYDRTLWYAITQKGISILQNCENESTKLVSGTNETGEAIPDSSQDLKNQYLPYKDIVAYLNEKSGKAFKPTSKSTQALINARLGEGYTVDDFKHVIDKKVAEWKGNDRMEPYLRPETLFGCKFKNYMKQEGVSESDTDYPFIIDLNGLF